MCIRDRSPSQLARRAKRSSPRLGVCGNSEPHFPEAGAGGAAPPALGSALWGAPKLSRSRATERA
eukprot:6926969-Alexandrium_andersonii.AAC.1